MSKSKSYDSTANYIIDKSVALPSMQDELLNYVLNMFEYKNLPDSIPRYYLEKYLIMLGFCAVVKVDGTLYALDGTLGGEEDVYHQPTKFIYANPALKKSSLVDLTDCVLCKNDYNMTGLMPLINRFAHLLVESNISLRTLLITSRMNITISASDEKTKASADKYIEGIENGKIYSIAESAFFDGVKVQSANTSSNFITQMIEISQFVKGSFLQAIGVNSQHNMKRQYINKDDTGLNDDGLRPFVDNMLACRKDFVEQLNEKFGLDVEVDFNSIWKQKEEEQLTNPVVGSESSQLDMEENNGEETEQSTDDTETDEDVSSSSEELPEQTDSEEDETDDDNSETDVSSSIESEDESDETKDKSDDESSHLDDEGKEDDENAEQDNKDESSKADESEKKSETESTEEVSEKGDKEEKA